MLRCRVGAKAEPRGGANGSAAWIRLHGEEDEGFGVETSEHLVVPLGVLLHLLDEEDVKRKAVAVDGRLDEVVVTPK